MLRNKNRFKNNYNQRAGISAGVLNIPEDIVTQEVINQNDLLRQLNFFQKILNCSK